MTAALTPSFVVVAPASVFTSFIVFADLVTCLYRVRVSFSWERIYFFSLSTSPLLSTTFCHRQRTGDIRRLVNNHIWLLVTIQRTCLQCHSECLLVPCVQQAVGMDEVGSAAFRIVSFLSETVLE